MQKMKAQLIPIASPLASFASLVQFRERLLRLFFLVVFIAVQPSAQAGQNDRQKENEGKVSEGHSQDLNELLKQVKTARSARVVLGNMTLRFWRNTLDPENPVMGCTYFTQDPVKIASLVTLIHDNVNCQEGAWGMGEAKEFISFELANSEKIDFWFPGSWEYDRPQRLPDEPLQVRVFRKRRGERTFFAVGANPSVIRLLYEWAIDVDPQKGCSFVTDYLSK